jgi:branched-chain amino acid transport system permease protein
MGRRGLSSGVRGLPYRNELLGLVAILAATLFFRPHVPAGVVALGVVSGATLAMHAVGMILVYRSGRFINFAQLQIGVFGSALFAGLVNGEAGYRLLRAACSTCAGTAPAPWLHWVNYAFAVVIGLGGAVLASVGMYSIVVRRFARAPKLVLTIATLFAAQTILWLQEEAVGALVNKRMREDGISAGNAAPLPIDIAIRITPTTLHLPQLLTIVAAIGAVVGLGIYLRRSVTGTAIRAASENPGRAATLGMNVDLVNGRVWVIVGALSGVAALLVAIVGDPRLQPGGPHSAEIPVELLVLILAVAIVARFESLAVAAAAAVTLGILQQSVQWSFSSLTPLQSAMVVIVGGMLLLQRNVVSRAERNEGSGWYANKELRPIPRELRSLPAVRKWLRIGSVLGAGLVLGLPWVLSPAQTSLTSSFGIYMIVGFSLLVLTGWAGQVSLGQFAFATIGAWAAAASRLPFVLALPLAGVAGAVAAVAVGLPALKLRGQHLAISSLAFAVSASALFVGDGYFGKRLPPSLHRPVLLGIDLRDQRAFYYMVLVALGLAMAVVVGLRRSRTGRVLIAARDNEASAQAFGVNLLRVRLSAFAVSGFIAAVAGALFAFSINNVSADAFSATQSVRVFIFAVIGGLGGLAGPIVGFVYFGLLTFFSQDETVRALASGPLGIVLLIWLPGGLAQGLYEIRDAMLRRVAMRHRIIVPSLVADARAGSLDGRARIQEKTRAGGGAAFIPTRYEPEGQWALARYGTDDPNQRERVGG